jgi:hypothetical protein
MSEELGIVNDKCRDFNFDFVKIFVYSAVILWNNVLGQRGSDCYSLPLLTDCNSINRVANNS